MVPLRQIIRLFDDKKNKPSQLKIIPRFSNIWIIFYLFSFIFGTKAHKLICFTIPTTWCEDKIYKKITSPIVSNVIKISFTIDRYILIILQKLGKRIRQKKMVKTNGYSCDDGFPILITYIYRTSLTIQNHTTEYIFFVAI